MVLGERTILHGSTMPPRKKPASSPAPGRATRSSSRKRAASPSPPPPPPPAASRARSRSTKKPEQSPSPSKRGRGKQEVKPPAEEPQETPTRVRGRKAAKEPTPEVKTSSKSKGRKPAEPVEETVTSGRGRSRGKASAPEKATEPANEPDLPSPKGGRKSKTPSKPVKETPKKTPSPKKTPPAKQPTPKKTPTPKKESPSKKPSSPKKSPSPRKTPQKASPAKSPVVVLETDRSGSKKRKRETLEETESKKAKVEEDVPSDVVAEETAPGPGDVATDVDSQVQDDVQEPADVPETMETSEEEDVQRTAAIPEAPKTSNQTDTEETTKVPEAMEMSGKVEEREQESETVEPEKPSTTEDSTSEKDDAEQQTDDVSETGVSGVVEDEKESAQDEDLKEDVDAEIDEVEEKIEKEEAYTVGDEGLPADDSEKKEDIEMEDVSVETSEEQGEESIALVQEESEKESPGQEVEESPTSEQPLVADAEEAGVETNEEHSDEAVMTSQPSEPTTAEPAEEEKEEKEEAAMTIEEDTEQPIEEVTEADPAAASDVPTDQPNMSDYVLVDMGEVPPPDSDEVQSAVPRQKPAPEEVPEQVNNVNGGSAPAVDKLLLFQRKFVPNPEGPGSADESGKFSLVQYNILAECHRKRSDYSFTSEEFLSFPYRHNRLMEELVYLDGDIVCLQEVEPGYYEETLAPRMRQLGYEGLFKRRVRNDYFPEGEATFFKSSRFTLVSCSSHSLADLADKDVDETELSEDVKQAVKSFLSHSAVILITKLKCNNTDKEFTVGNVHINWSQGFKLPDVQCSQISCAIRQLVDHAGGLSCPHILAGDFNTVPNSPCYNLIKESYLRDKDLEHLQSLTQVPLPDGQQAALVNLLWKNFQHTSPNLRSAYFTVMGQEPDISTFNKFMKASVDYTFFSPCGLYLIGSLQGISPDHMTPSETFPSDHVSFKHVFALL